MEISETDDIPGVGVRRGRTDAESEEEEQGDGMGAQAPAQVPLTRLSNLIGHCEDRRRLIMDQRNDDLAVALDQSHS